VRGRFCYPRPDGPVVGADGASIQIWDEDINPDDLLATGVTDAFGYFDISFNYTQNEAPDIYTRILMANQEIHCAWEGYTINTWVWRTHTKDDYGGTDIDYGWFGPADAGKRAVPNVLSIGTRAWRWSYNQGYDPPQTYLYIPSSNHAFYSYTIPAIKVGNPDFYWEEPVVSHEYGHHWVWTQSDCTFYDGIYCNMNCDALFPFDCGHCDYSEENEAIAWTEGFPNWYAANVVDEHFGLYGEIPFRLWDLDDHEPMAAGLNANIVEGCFSRLLYDISDSNYDDDPVFPDGVDQINMPSVLILNIAHNQRPLTPAQFHQAFLGLPGDDVRSQYWSTAMNNGYQLDHTNPPAPTNLTSPSHDTATSSSDDTIDYTWTAPVDDFSGLDGYSVLISDDFASPPDYNRNLPGTITAFTTAGLDPGVYYFNIRAVDRAGNWSGYATYGPITIRDPYPPDLTDTQPLGWDNALVPRNDTAAGPGNVHVPSTLTADTWMNYYNLAVINNGELATNTQWDIGFHVDGVHVTTEYITPPINLAAGGIRTWYDRNFGYVDGGLHMLSVDIDMDETEPELNEADNYHGAQYVWEPEPLSAGSPVTSNHPPDPTGGFWLVWMGYNPNVDGYAVSGFTGTFVAGELVAANDADDFDCRLYPHAIASTYGFRSDNLEAVSSRPAGCVDAALFHLHNSHGATHDVGVTNYADDTGNYTVARRESTPIAYDTMMDMDLAADQYLALGEFSIAAGDVGYITIELYADPAGGPLHLGHLPSDYVAGGLDDLATTAVTDGEGVASVTFYAPAAEVHGLAVWRDPAEIPATKAAPAAKPTVRVRRTPPDVLPIVSAGWYAPLVPRPAPDGTPASVPAPASLLGDVPTTYLNSVFRNQGPWSASDVGNSVQLDGAEIVAESWPFVSAGQVRMSISYTGHTVRGGLHTLGMVLDPAQTVEETDETNNAFARQWVWSPTVMNFNMPVVRQAPPDPEGGWAELLASDVEPLPNCDGLGVPTLVESDHGYWIAAAVMPGDSSDVDVRLHDQHYSPQQGFDEIRSVSAWPAGESDFVLMNSYLAQRKAMDAGVILAKGEEDYTAEVVGSTYLGRNPVGSEFPGLVEEGHILDLYDLDLVPGQYTITLVNQEGQADLGLTLHPCNVPYAMKALWVEGGESWRAGPGQDEQIAVEITTAGRYGLTVWKASHADLSALAMYELVFTAGLSGTPGGGDLPRATSIASIHPNPFNPETVVAFDLEEQCEVRLEVYDVRGGLVCRLVAGATMAAGRHEESWNGQDDRGNRVPSGIYMVRLRAGGEQHYRKATLLK